MILYTMMPNELIFPSSDDDYMKQEQMMLHGVPVIVERSDKEIRVVRLLSTNPEHYLDNRLIPGTTFPI